VTALKCPKCALVAWGSDASCRRCGINLATTASPMPAVQVSHTTVRPGVFKFIRTDYASSLAVICPVVMAALYVATGVFGIHFLKRGREVGGDGTAFLWMAVIATAVCVPLLIWRVTAFQGIFARGVEVPATITSSSFHRGRGRIEFTYLFNGRQYHRGAAVQENGAVRALLSHAVTTALVDPQAPNKAVLRELYSR
jgi:hypothetical protein